MHWDGATKTKTIKYISMLSTVHTFDLVNTNKTNRETGAIIQKPDAILDYNKTMGGVDLVSRSRVQWYRKIAELYSEVSVSHITYHIL